MLYIFFCNLGLLSNIISLNFMHVSADIGSLLCFTIVNHSIIW